MKICTVYTKGNREINEDAIVVDTDQNIFAVIDGATGLGGLPGSLASGIVKEYLEKNTSIPLIEKVKEGNKQLLAAAEKNIGTSLDQIPKYKRSSCGLAAIQIHLDEEGKANSLDYVSAGDCMLFLEFKDGSIRQITYDHIDRFDTVAIQLMQNTWEKVLKEKSIDSFSPEQLKEKQRELRGNVQHILQENRNKLNTIDGYGIIDGDHEAVKFFEYGRIPLISVNKILLLSDGLKIHTERTSTKQETWLTTAQSAFKSGLSELEKRIIKDEESDPACFYFPRLKQHDDKSGILIVL